MPSNCLQREKDYRHSAARRLDLACEEEESDLAETESAEGLAARAYRAPLTGSRPDDDTQRTLFMKGRKSDFHFTFWHFFTFSLPRVVRRAGRKDCTVSYLGYFPHRFGTILKTTSKTTSKTVSLRSAHSCMQHAAKGDVLLFRCPVHPPSRFASLRVRILWASSRDQASAHRRARSC